jgi:hypothetical protein
MGCSAHHTFQTTHWGPARAYFGHPSCSHTTCLRRYEHIQSVTSLTCKTRSFAAALKKTKAFHSAFCSDRFTYLFCFIWLLGSHEMNWRLLYLVKLNQGRHLTVQWRDTHFTVRFVTVVKVTHTRYEGRDLETRFETTGRTTVVRVSAGAETFCLRHRVQTDCGAHPASYPMGTGGSLPGGK